MRIDTVFIALGLVVFLVGTVFGAWMGALENFQLANAHAHLNLLGFVASVLYGLIHRAYPSLRTSRLSWVQCLTHFLGVGILVPGIIIVDRGGSSLVVAIGSVLVIVAVLLFLYIFLGRANRAADA